MAPFGVAAVVGYGEDVREYEQDEDEADGGSGGQDRCREGDNDYAQAGDACLGNTDQDSGKGQNEPFADGQVE